MKKRGKVKGYLTVFVCLTLVAMVGVYLLLFEGVRHNTMCLESECITDTGMNSIMAEYHRELFNRYGLFYIDTSYGTEYPSVYLTLAHLKYYLNKNLECDNVKFFPRMYMDPLKLQIEEIEPREVSLATDMGGYSLQRQALQVMKSDMGLQDISQLLNWLQVIEDYKLFSRNMEKEQEETLNALEESKWVAVKESESVTQVEKIRRKGILNLVLDRKQVSDTEICKENYISVRKDNEGMNQGNLNVKEELNLAEKILFYEYILKYTGRYTMPRDDSLLSYQTEYLLMGSESDIENLRKVANRICSIREVANTITIYNTPTMLEAARVMATTISGALLLPELEPVFEASIVLGWAYMESLYDVSCLLKGEKVEMIKDSQSFHYSLEEALSGSYKEVVENKEIESGLGYEDYLKLLLYMEDQELITYRLMDIMEMDIRKTQGNERFRMDGCMDRLGICVRYQSMFGYEHTIEIIKEY